MPNSPMTGRYSTDPDRLALMIAMYTYIRHTLTTPSPVTTLSHHHTLSSRAGIFSSSDFGDENIRIGEDSMHTYVSRTIVEYCVFNSTYGADSEAVSIKVTGLELEFLPSKSPISSSYF